MKKWMVFRARLNLSSSAHICFLTIQYLCLLLLTSRVLRHRHLGQNVADHVRTNVNSWKTEEWRVYLLYLLTTGTCKDLTRFKWMAFWHPLLVMAILLQWSSIQTTVTQLGNVRQFSCPPVIWCGEKLNLECHVCASIGSVDKQSPRPWDSFIFHPVRKGWCSMVLLAHQCKFHFCLLSNTRAAVRASSYFFYILPFPNSKENERRL